MRVLLILSLIFTSEWAQADTTYLAVGKAKTRRSVLAIAPLVWKGPGRDKTGAGRKIYATLQNDLIFMDLFSLLPSSSFIEKPTAGVAPQEFRMKDWSTIGTEYLIKAAASVQGKTLTLESYLYQVKTGKQLIAKRYISEIKETSTVAHTFANDIVKKLTGLPGIFLTKIVMACQRKGSKDIYVMDFDGKNPKQITHHKSIAFAPNWSPDGTRVAYTVYTRRKGKGKNPDLYEFDFRSDRIRLLSNRKGINSGASYSPDGRKIAMTMSFLGNPEIFLLDRSSRKAERVTKSFGFDVDPTWSPDGRKLAFVSSRTGKPMIFTMNRDGTDPKRLTFAGRYNAAPSWSPQNNKIAFAGWKSGKFEIFIMNTDGSKIERLTKGVGNNEDPSFSPDGNFIAFSSNRTGRKNIYVMNIDGSFVKRLTYGMGDCAAPKWGPPPRE